MATAHTQAGVSCSLLIFTLLIMDSVTDFSCPSSCFCNVAKGYVECIGDGLWQIPEDIPTGAERLSLRSYIIESLQQIDFLGLMLLRELKLTQNQVSVIENGTFALLNSLERLDLSQNNLVNITELTFYGLFHLQYLDLSANSLENIDRAFYYLNNVEQLNLRENRIYFLNDDTFIGLHKLVYLNLDSNHIQTIEENSFKLLLNLAHLILSSNPVLKLNTLYFDGLRLQYIDLSNCSLRNVPRHLTNNVRDLRLTKNNLTIIHPDDFDNYPFLELLVLDDNQIIFISDQTLTKLPFLQRLWLNGNNLTSLPQGLPSSLRTLCLEENQIQMINQTTFMGLIHLQQLILQRNNITEIASCALCDLWSLNILDLQANQIETVTEGMFNNLTRLTNLDLSQNPIHTFQLGCFKNMEHLVTLQLSRVKGTVTFSDATFDGVSNLTSLDLYNSPEFSHALLNSARTLQSLHNLQELNIMHNNLINLRPDFPVFFPQVRIIKMGGNPWHCDRNIFWLIQWIKTTSHVFYRVSDNRCASPDHLKDKPVVLIGDRDFVLPTASPTSDKSSTSPPQKDGITTYIIVFNHTVTANATIRPASAPPTNESDTLTTKIKMEENSTLTTKKSPMPSGSTIIRTEISNEPKSTSTVDFPKSTGMVSLENNLTTSNEPRTSTSMTTELVTLRSFSNNASLTSSIPSNHISTGNLHATMTDTPVFVQTNSHMSTSMPIVKKVIEISSPDKHITGLPRIGTIHDSSRRVPLSQETTVIIAVSTTCVGVILLGLVTAFAIYKCKETKTLERLVHRGSISYCPQKDEVSIYTVTEPIPDWTGEENHAISNKLYFIMEAADADTVSDNQPD